MKASATVITRAVSQEQSSRIHPTSFIALYDLYFAWVYNYVRYRCNDADIADNLARVGNPGTVISDPKPVPTPLAPPATRTFLPSQPFPSLQHTPFLTFVTTPDNLAP